MCHSIWQKNNAFSKKNTCYPPGCDLFYPPKIIFASSSLPSVGFDSSQMQICIWYLQMCLYLFVFLCYVSPRPFLWYVTPIGSCWYIADALNGLWCTRCRVHELNMRSNYFFDLIPKGICHGWRARSELAVFQKSITESFGWIFWNKLIRALWVFHQAMINANCSDTFWKWKNNQPRKQCPPTPLHCETGQMQEQCP